MTLHAEPENYFNSSLNFADGNYKIHYPSFMRSAIYNLTKITGLDSLTIFRFAGLFSRFILVIVIYKIYDVILKELTKKNHTHSTKNAKYFSNIMIILMIVGHAYFWARSFITFPENFGLLFHGLSLLYFTKFLIKAQGRYIFAYCLFASMSLYYHNPSFIVVCIIGLGFLSGTIHNWISGKISGNEFFAVGIKSLLVFFVISLPMLSIVFKEYSRQLRENVGQNIVPYGDISRFRGPNINDYIKYSSGLIFIGWSIFLLSLLHYIRIQNKTETFMYPLIALFLGTLYLTNGVRVKLNVPIDRMQGYFIIPIIIVSSLALRKEFLNKSAILKVALVFLMFCLGIANLVKVNGRFKLWKGEIATSQYLKEGFDQSKRYYFDEPANFFEFQFPYYKNIILHKQNLKKGDIIITYEKQKEYMFHTGSIYIYEKK